MMNYLQKKKKALMNYVSSGGRLPSEYQEVEWIESTGTQYIVTDSYAFSGLKVVLDILHSSTQSVTEVFININTSTILWLGFRNSKIILDSATLTTNIFERHTYTVNYSNPSTIEDDLGNTATYRTAPNPNTNLTIFATHTGGNKSKVRAYSFKFYDTTNNDELVRDLVPCYRKADNKTGLYDVVNSTFFANNGTGEFSVGNDVN